MKTKKPSKQRKRLHQAPLHIRGKILSSPLSTELKSRFKTNSVTVRRGDTVKILKGDRKGFEGKISRVDRKNYKVFVENITRDKSDGTTTPIPIHHSNVVVTSLNLDDKWRRKSLEKRVTVIEAETPEKKPQEKTEETRKTEELAEVKEVGGT